MGFGPAEVAPGRVVFTCQPGENHYNPIGVVHGGLISPLLDSAMACAVQTMLPVGVVYTTLELHINFVRAVTRDTGVMRSEGTVLRHAGRRIATAEGKVTGPDGRLYGHGTTTCMIVGAGE